MRRIAIAALAITLAGCSTSDSLGPSGSVEGTYSLALLNGSRLPFTFSNGLTLVSDDLTLYPDGSYSDFSQYSTGATRTENGFYSENNGSLLFQPNAGGSYQGSINGRVLTQIVGGYEQRFEKQ
jgi:hypothetical protein